MRRSEQDDRYIKFLFRNNNSKHNILYYFEEKMKKNLEILEIEAKLDKNEKKYWRVKTAKGWMSCWDVVVKDAIRDAVNKSDSGIACCDVIEKKGTNFRGEETIFYNITKCYGEAESIQSIPSIQTPPIQSIQDEKPEVVKPGVRSDGIPYPSCDIRPLKNMHKKDYANNHATMYVSYAKDIFGDMYEPDFNKEDLMNTAINLVKQAKEAFE